MSEKTENIKREIAERQEQVRLLRESLDEAASLDRLEDVKRLTADLVGYEILLQSAHRRLEQAQQEATEDHRAECQADVKAAAEAVRVALQNDVKAAKKVSDAMDGLMQAIGEMVGPGRIGDVRAHMDVLCRRMSISRRMDMARTISHIVGDDDYVFGQLDELMRYFRTPETVRVNTSMHKPDLVAIYEERIRRLASSVDALEQQALESLT